MKKLFITLNSLLKSSTKLHKIFFIRLFFIKIEFNYSLFISKDKTIYFTIYIYNIILFHIKINFQINNFIKNFENKFFMIDPDDILYYPKINLCIHLENKTIYL